MLNALKSLGGKDEWAWSFTNSRLGLAILRYVRTSEELQMMSS